MKRVDDHVAMESKHYAAIQRPIRGYTLCKLQGQWSQLWRGLEASHCSYALSNTVNAISEAMNVLC